MPIVPTFQGGVPQVRDSGGSGFIPARPPAVNVDAYGRMMQQAMRPIEEWSNSLTEALRIEHQRTVKAESDEAEVRFMDAVNKRLYDPEAGYFNNQGKQAVDAYKATYDGLVKDANDIVGTLTPAAREAVGSRIADRLRSAQLKATQWNNQQRKAWHVGSSQSRINALIQSIGENYADADFCGATYGSLDQELTYLANLQGYSAEQVTELKQGYWDLAQAQRYTNWSQDNPVTALEDFQANRDAIGAKVRETIGEDLWRASKPELAMLVSNITGDSLLDKKDFIREMLQPGRSLGVPVVDNLTRAQKIDLFSAAYSHSAQKRAGVRQELQRMVENSYALTAQEGIDLNPLPKDLFITAYGQKQGELAFDDYSDGLRMRESVYGFNGLSNTDIASTLETLRPQRGSANYAAEAKNYQVAQKAAEIVLKTRRDDPVGFATRDTKYGITEIKDWAAGDVTQKLSARLPVYDQIAQDYGTPKTLLTKDETQTLTQHFNSLEPSEQIKFLTSIAEPLSGDGVLSVLGTQIKSEDSRLGTALFVMDGNVENGSKYLRGRQFVDEKRLTLPTKGEGSMEDFGRILGDEEGVDGITRSKSVRSTMVDAAQGLWAYEQVAGDGATSEDIVTSAFGDIADYNGKKIFLPKRPSGASYTTGTVSGWFSRDFFDLIDLKIKNMEKDKTVLKTMYGEVEARYFAPKIRSMRLESVGNGQYRIIDLELGYVRNADNTPYVLDLNPEQVNVK